MEDYVRLKLRGSSKRTTLYEIREIKPDSIKKYETTEEKIIDGKRWLRTLPTGELSSEEKQKFEFENEDLFLINQEGIYAIRNYCPHMNLPLDIGQLTEQGTINGWMQSLNISQQECEPLTIIPTMISDNY